MFRTPHPQMGPGWQPMAQPAPGGNAALVQKLAREIVLLGGLFLVAVWLGVFSTPYWGVVAVLATRMLLAIFLRNPRRIRTLMEWAAVAGVAFLVATSSQAPPAKTVTQRVPLKVESVQPGSLEEIRDKAADIWEQALKGGRTLPGAQPKEAKHK